MTIFSSSIINDAKIDARSKYPNESCGIITGNAYIACDNIATEPTKDFQIATSITQPLIIAGTLQGIIHSHPVENLVSVSCPSAADMTSQVASNIPWGIIDIDDNTINEPYFWGDFLLDEAILGQTFHHGVNDCYTLVRKWYWQKRQVKLPEYPRDDLWWTKEQNLYMDGFKSAGFSEIDGKNLQDGDLMLGKVRSTVINHAGIYLDNLSDGQGLVLHHLYGRLSRRESAYSYLNRAELFLRYTNAD